MRWPSVPQRSEVVVDVRPFAQLPNSSRGTPPRLNAIAHVNGRLFVLDETDGRIDDITAGQDPFR